MEGHLLEKADFSLYLSERDNLLYNSNSSNLMTSYSTEPHIHVSMDANDEDQCHRLREGTLQ